MAVSMAFYRLLFLATVRRNTSVIPIPRRNAEVCLEAMYTVAVTKRTDQDRIERRMLAALAAVLPQSVRAEVLSGEGPSLVISVGWRRLVLRWVGRAGVREVRNMLGLRERPDVIVGAELSLAARAAAGQGGLGWVDETGSAEIAAGNLVVSRLTRPDRVATTHPKGWTPSVIGVAEALLAGTTPTVAAAAHATGHSLSSTAHALSALTDMGLLESDAQRGTALWPQGRGRRSAACGVRAGRRPGKSRCVVALRRGVA